MRTDFLKVTIGTLGVGATEVVNQATTIDPNRVNDAVGLIGQLVIIIATILSLFKRKKPKSEG